MVLFGYNAHLWNGLIDSIRRKAYTLALPDWYEQIIIDAFITQFFN